MDFVLDPIGGDTRMQSIDVAKQSGVVVSIVPFQLEEAQEKASEKGVNLIILRADGNKEELLSLAGLLEQGLIKT